jgi:hypothetical protein
MIHVSEWSGDRIAIAAYLGRSNAFDQEHLNLYGLVRDGGCAVLGLQRNLGSGLLLQNR